MPDKTHTKPEPHDFRDLDLQPTGPGPADLEMRHLKADMEDASEASTEAGIADETAAYDQAMTPTPAELDAEEIKARSS